MDVFKFNTKAVVSSLMYSYIIYLGKSPCLAYSFLLGEVFQFNMHLFVQAV